MALIKCPQCGHSVLSVATSCPHCSMLLTQNPMQEGPGATESLRRCRHCKKLVDRHQAVCTYCGYHVRRWRIVRWSGVSVAAAVVVIFVAVVALRSQPAPAIGTTAPIPEPAVVPPAAPPLPDPVAPPRTDPAPPLGERAAVPRDANLPIRWTTNWANVREGRGTETRVLRILRPGARVQVGNRERGWSAVYLNGELAGYVSNELLTADTTAAADDDGSSGGTATAARQRDSGD